MVRGEHAAAEDATAAAIGRGRHAAVVDATVDITAGVTAGYGVGSVHGDERRRDRLDASA